MIVVTETDSKGINSSDGNYYLYDNLSLVARGNVWIEKQFTIAYEMIQVEKQKHENYLLEQELFDLVDQHSHHKSLMRLKDRLSEAPRR